MVCEEGDVEALVIIFILNYARKTCLQFRSSSFKINVHRWMVHDKRHAKTKGQYQDKTEKKRLNQISQDITKGKVSGTIANSRKC